MRLLFLLFAGCAFGGCSLVRNSPKYDLANGWYTATRAAEGPQKVYVYNQSDTVYVHSTNSFATEPRVDASAPKTALPPVAGDTLPAKLYLRQPSLDIDFLTIPLKYRPQQAAFPRQLTTSLNGAAYFGYRTDVYSIHYDQHPVGAATREVSHYGFSAGGFTGIGATAVNPWVTRDAITIEYDGLVWSKGVAAIVAVNNFTAGLALGWDHLLDPNRKTWIYQGKPWAGLVFGLNLN